MTQYRLTIHFEAWAAPPHRREIFSEDLDLLKIVGLLLLKHSALTGIEVHDMGTKGVPVLLYRLRSGEEHAVPHPSLKRSTR